MRHYAAEFEATAENGIIRLPAEYPELANATLRVLVLSDEPPQTDTKAAGEEQLVAARLAKHARLIAAFDKLTQVSAFREIADPVQWQRDLRSED